MLRRAISASVILIPLGPRWGASWQATVSPVQEGVAAIGSTPARRLASGGARRFREIWQNRRCSILVRFEAPGG
jgi:hypothetical protein